MRKRFRLPAVALAAALGAIKVSPPAAPASPALTAEATPAQRPEAAPPAPADCATAAIVRVLSNQPAAF